MTELERHQRAIEFVKKSIPAIIYSDSLKLMHNNCHCCLVSHVVAKKIIHGIESILSEKPVQPRGCPCCEVEGY